MNRMGDPNVTENKVEPATDEEIETAQRLSALNIACPPWDVLALIARIDAECTRADEAETRVEEIELDAEKVAAEFEGDATRSEEHTSELQSLMRISYAVFCLKKKTKNTNTKLHN